MVPVRNALCRPAEMAGRQGARFSSVARRRTPNRRFGAARSPTVCAFACGRRLIGRAVADFLSGLSCDACPRRKLRILLMLIAASIKATKIVCAVRPRTRRRPGEANAAVASFLSRPLRPSIVFRGEW